MMRKNDSSFRSHDDDKEKHKNVTMHLFFGRNAQEMCMQKQ